MCGKIVRNISETEEDSFQNKMRSNDLSKSLFIELYESMILVQIFLSYYFFVLFRDVLELQCNLSFLKI